MKAFVVLLSIVGSSAFAMSPVETKTPVEVSYVNSAVFTSPFEVVDGQISPAALTVKYSTGGCGSEGHRTTYRLEKIAEAGPSDLLTFKVHVFQTVNGGCRMAYEIKDSVNLTALLEQQAKRLGVNLEILKKESTSVRFVAPEVAGFVLLGNN